MPQGGLPRTPKKSPGFNSRWEESTRLLPPSGANVFNPFPSLVLGLLCSAESSRASISKLHRIYCVAGLILTRMIEGVPEHPHAKLRTAVEQLTPVLRNEVIPEWYLCEIQPF
jgi:hypothetical protein